MGKLNGVIQVNYRPLSQLMLKICNIYVIFIIQISDAAPHETLNTSM